MWMIRTWLESHIGNGTASFLIEQFLSEQVESEEPDDSVIFTPFSHLPTQLFLRSFTLQLPSRIKAQSYRQRPFSAWHSHTHALYWPTQHKSPGYQSNAEGLKRGLCLAGCSVCFVHAGMDADDFPCPAMHESQPSIHPRQNTPKTFHTTLTNRT